MRVKPKPLKLKGIHRVKKKQADGSIKVHLYFRATGAPLDPNNLAQSYAAAEKAMRSKGEAHLSSSSAISTDRPTSTVSAKHRARNTSGS